MIKYSIGQPNMLERNDCMVRALANTLDKPYYEVWAQLKRMGRRSRCGTPVKIGHKAMLMYGLKLASPVRRRTTHAQFIASHPKGSYLVMSRSHAWAIKDGVVYDAWRPGPRKQIVWFGAAV